MWILSAGIDLTFMGPCIVNVFLSTTNKMQRYTIFFIVVSALHVSRGFSAHHQELKNCIYSFWAPDDERKTRSKHVEHWQQ